MCRMMAFFGKEPIKIPEKYLKIFIRNCHFGNFSRGDYLGHHGMGFGILYFDENERVHVKRSINKIWKADPKYFLDIESKCIIIHARKCLPRDKKKEDVHPITIDKKTFMFHNGTIKKSSFSKLNDKFYDQISKHTSMDTRKYLATYLDSLKFEIENNSHSISSNDISFPIISQNPQNNLIEKSYNAIKKTLSNLQLISAANSFIINKNFLCIIEYKRDFVFLRNLNYTLNIGKISNNAYCVSVIPFTRKFKPIPNKSAIFYDFTSNKIYFYNL
ncbi:MAG: class II glutamine amidotransferase [Promethearchaeota archaeon]